MSVIVFVVFILMDRTRVWTMAAQVAESDQIKQVDTNHSGKTSSHGLTVG